MVELRWLSNGISKTLQYRTIEERKVTRWEYIDSAPLEKVERTWSEWINVPEIRSIDHTYIREAPKFE